jgi:hypothetical protein
LIRWSDASDRMEYIIQFSQHPKVPGYGALVH